MTITTIPKLSPPIHIITVTPLPPVHSITHDRPTSGFTRFTKKIHPLPTFKTYVALLLYWPTIHRTEHAQQRIDKPTQQRATIPNERGTFDAAAGGSAQGKSDNKKSYQQKAGSTEEINFAITFSGSFPSGFSLQASVRRRRRQQRRRRWGMVLLGKGDRHEGRRAQITAISVCNWASECFSHFYGGACWLMLRWTTGGAPV